MEIGSCFFRSDMLSLMGDQIGMESCVDLKENAEEEREGTESPSRRRPTERSRRWGTTRRNREFPPPIPLLARTENLHSRMPWVLKRYYTSDGRLILKEEKVRHHEYFRAHRSNGRLTLQLVPLDDDVHGPRRFDDEEDDDPDDGDDVNCHDREGEEDRAAVDVGEESFPELAASSSLMAESSPLDGIGKCFTYDGIFGMGVPAIRPVRS